MTKPKTVTPSYGAHFGVMVFWPKCISLVSLLKISVTQHFITGCPSFTYTYHKLFSCCEMKSMLVHLVKKIEMLTVTPEEVDRNS